MITKFFIVAATALLAAAAARAQEATPAPEIDHFKPQLSRAAVVAATQQAARDGLIARNEADVQRIAARDFTAELTRAQVLAELAEARRLGLTEPGEAGVQATAVELKAIRQAGLRATQGSVLAARR